MALVTLLSDFGARDQYVSEMKGTLFTLCPSATVVDISHEIEKFNVRMGAFVLASASSYFPEGTIHVAVVDPGVGRSRRSLLIDTSRAIYIGPDNGILIPAAAQDGIKAAYSIENPRFMRTPVSSTFHGRDVFAYAAAKIACGADYSDIGPGISDPVPAAFPKATASRGQLSCEVILADSFGNIVTTALEKDMAVSGIEIGSRVKARARRRVFTLDIVRSYSDSPAGRGVLLLGSHGFLEVAVNKGSAAKCFRLRTGDKLIFLSAAGCRS
jgi:S-adenosylmethionine hydrolase